MIDLITQYHPKLRALDRNLSNAYSTIVYTIATITPRNTPINSIPKQVRLTLLEGIYLPLLPT